MASLPANPSIERFKNNIASYHNAFNTCWNVMVTYLLIYNDQTRDTILDVVLLSDLDYTKPIKQYEHLIITRAQELVESAFKTDKIDIVLPLSKSSPYFPYYKLKKKDNVIEIIIEFMLRINRKCNEYNMNQLENVAAESPQLRRAESFENEECIQKKVQKFFDYDENYTTLNINHILIYFNLLSTIFINKLYYIQPIKLNSEGKDRCFIEMVEREGYKFSVGYIIVVPSHAFCILKYHNNWKFCDNHYIYDFNMEQFKKDLTTPKIQISYNLHQGLFRMDDDTIEYYSTNLPREIKKLDFDFKSIDNITQILRVVEHDASKLPFRDSIRKFVYNPPLKTDIIYLYNIYADCLLMKSIVSRDNDTVLQLIMDGVNIDMITQSHISPLTIAMRYNNIEAIKLLIKYGCDIFYSNFYTLPDGPNKEVIVGIIEERKKQIKSGQLITPELQQLYDIYNLKYEEVQKHSYEEVQKHRYSIKQFYENLSTNAKEALYAYHQYLKAEYNLKIPIESFISVYNYMIFKSIVNSVRHFKEFLNIKEDGLQYLMNRLESPAYIKYVEEQALKSKKNKYIKYDESEKYANAESKRLGNIFHKKYIMYDESKNSHPNFEKDFKSLYQKYKQKYLQLKAASKIV
jgi:hypothetical protein